MPLPSRTGGIMFALGVGVLILGYGFVYSGYSQLTTRGQGTGLFESFGLPALIGGATPAVANGSGQMGGQPASPSTGGMIAV